MAKIGTAHIEVKAVINEEALEQISVRVEAAVRKGVEAGMKAAHSPVGVEIHFAGQLTDDLRPARNGRVGLGQ